MYSIEQYRARHSVRTYDTRPVEQHVLASLRSKVTDINTHGIGMHLQIVTDDPEPFRGFTRSYGMFRGVRNYIACVVDTSYSNREQRLGYHIMDVVMRAHALGLGTCIVGATFDSKRINARIRVGEEMPVIITFGYPEGGGERGIGALAARFIHRKKISPAQMLAKGCDYDTCPEEVKLALEAISIAPSAYNAHPARLFYRPDQPVKMIKQKSGKFADIDMGIAMFCYTDVCGGGWEWGEIPTLMQE